VIFDAGLQPERTALAWRRTALSVLVGSVAGGRLLAPQLGVLAVVAGVLGCAFGAWMYVAAGARSRHATRTLLAEGHLRSGPGAGALAVTAGFGGVLGVFALILVLDHGLGGILTSR
jgi:uncharacterized membrane protein YidH (DUF202 family)